MERYLGNLNKMEVHDTLNEQVNCQLGEIKAQHRRYYATLREAHADGHDNCHWCLGDSKR